ncbi:MAG: 4-(cytidine 5'-diphospho)-2-C-methyl-D-erythritol kinase [Clostridia bacterium]|nr:4-(cytidine 5'-diphospho)-2-C-methyl-D-erythritol kinase [Clostridia bacterium]
MNRIRIKVNAKINLSLDITGVREDGYHNLDMLMTSVDIFDIISAQKSNESRVVMDGKVADANNTAVKALALLQEKFNIAMSVDIVKGIPLSAGMGGSSADASGVFYCANKLFGISVDEMIPLALKVGCDVPYMIFGGGARVQGVGEIITPVEIQPLTLVIAQKTVGSSTKDIYKKYDAVGGDRCDGKPYFNALERSAVLLNPQIADAKMDLLKFSDRVFMTGSGSAYVGVFDDDQKAKRCLESLQDYVFCKLAHTKSQGIEIIEQV